MGFFFQELVNGLTTGALYSLVALGFSMVYGVLKLLNFAHGDLYMVGASRRLLRDPVVRRALGADISVPLLLLIMFVLAAGLVGGLGVAIERFAYRPLRDAPRIAPLITAIGISFFLENAALLLFGGQSRVYNTADFISLSTGITIGPVTSTRCRSWCWSSARAHGRPAATGQPDQARQADAGGGRRPGGRRDDGHQREPVIAATFFLGSALAGVAGVMAGLMFNQVTTYIGFIVGPQGVHRRRGRRHRLDCPARCSAAC